MDENLCKIIRDTFPQVNAFNERMKRLGSSIQGIETVDESYLKNILDPEASASFFKKKAEAVKKDEKELSSFREQFSIFCDSCFDEAKDYYRYNVSVVRTIILSIKDMIPFKLNKKEKAFSETIVKVTEGLLMHLDALDSVIQAEMDGIHHIKTKRGDKTDNLKLIAAKASAPIHSLVGLNFLTITCIFLHQIVYEYFNCTKKKKAEKADMISLIASALSIYLEPKINDIKNDTEQIAKKTEQVLKSRETKNESLKTIKENQEKIKELVKDRNELDAEKTGTLSVEECVVIIGLITRHYFNLKQRDCKAVGFPPEVVKMKKATTIKRNIEFWDQYQNGNKAKGRKPPRKDYSRNMSKEKFGQWYNEIQLDQYNKWKAKNRIDALIGKSTKRFGDE